MSEIAYVKQEIVDRLRDWERRFQVLPAAAGVAFVSIAARPQPGGETNLFDVVVGISREFLRETGEAVVRHILADEIKNGAEFFIQVHRGVACANSGLPSALRDRLAPVGVRRGS